MRNHSVQCAAALYYTAVGSFVLFFSDYERCYLPSPLLTTGQDLWSASGSLSLTLIPLFILTRQAGGIRWVVQGDWWLSLYRAYLLRQLSGFE